MNENINLCELLKGHEGETFYSPVFGSIKFNEILRDCTHPLCFSVRNTTTHFTKEGKMFADENVELMIFPSKDQRDWNKWAEEHNHKVPKTWSELIKIPHIGYRLESYEANEKRQVTYISAIGNTPIEKSVLALLKIHQLIEIGYGGNVTSPEEPQDTIVWNYTNNEPKFESWRKLYDSFAVIKLKYGKAKEFLSHPENIQLIKDFYMISK